METSVPITAAGAKCDGTSDDTAAVNRLLAALASGATVAIGAGQFCSIQSANLTVPRGISITGSGRAIQPNTSPGSHAGSGFILSPAYTVTMGIGSSLENLGIWRSGLVVNPTAAQITAAVEQWGHESSTAVIIPYNTGGVRLDNLFIEGFNTAVHAYAGQAYLNEIWGDDFNGIVVSDAGDNTYVTGSRFEPFYSFGIPAPSAAWNRPGVAFYAYGGDTGLYLSRDFALCWQSGMLIDGVGVSNINALNVESCGSLGGVPASTGIRFINSNAATSIHNSFSSGYATGVSVEGGEVTVSGVYVSAPTTASFYLAGGYATPAQVIVSGRVEAGETVMETLSSARIAHSPITVSYTSVPGDTLSSVARGMQRAINTKQEIVAARISASVSDAVVQINWPADMSVVVHASGSDSIRATVRSGTAITPPTGAVLGAKTNSPHVPMFIIGNAVAQSLAWTIANPSISNGTEPLPHDWLTVPKVGDGSTKLITLSGVQWSRVSNESVSSCGIHPVVLAGATDGDGTVIEGSGATGCSVRFTTPFYRTPECLITGPTGVVLSGYTASPASLEIVHARTSGSKFSYHCRPN